MLGDLLSGARMAAEKLTDEARDKACEPLFHQYLAETADEDDPPSAEEWCFDHLTLQLMDLGTLSDELVVACWAWWFAPVEYQRAAASELVDRWWNDRREEGNADRDLAHENAVWAADRGVR